MARYSGLRAGFWDFSDLSTIVSYGGANYLTEIASAEVTKKLGQISRGRARFWKSANWEQFIQEGRIVAFYQQDDVLLDAAIPELVLGSREMGAFLIQKMKEGVDAGGRSYVDVSGLGVEHLLTKYRHWAPIGQETTFASTLVDAVGAPINTTVKAGTGVVNGLKSAILTSVDGVDEGDEIRITMDNSNVWVSKVTGVEEEGWLDNQLTFEDRIPVDASAGNAVQVRNAVLRIDSGETPTVTTLAAGCPTGNNSAVLTSTTGIEVGEQIRIELDAGGWHTSTLTAVNPVGAATNTVIFNTAMPSDAASGNDVEVTRMPLTSIQGFAEGQKVAIVLDDTSTFQTIIEDVDPEAGTIVLRDGLPSAASVGNSVTAYDYSTPATDDVTQIMAPAVSEGWSVEFDSGAYEGTADGTTHAPTGESVWDLLQATADMTGEVFRLKYLNGGQAPQLKIRWLRAFNDSAVVLTYEGTSSTATQTENVNRGVIHSIAREQESDIITRLYPVPADGRISFAACSAAALSAATSAGFTITTSTDLYRPDYIEYDAGVTAHGVLEGDRRFGSITLTKTATAAEVEAASDAMLQQCMTTLLEAQERTTWRLKAHMHRPLFPGQYVGLSNTIEDLGAGDGPTWATLYVLEVTEYLDAKTGVVMTDLVLSEEPYLLPTATVRLGRDLKATAQSARRAGQVYGNVTLSTGVVLTGTIDGGTVVGGSGVTDHGLLTGLTDDDHLQYLKTDGSRTLTGNMLVSSGITIDGVDISAHAANASAHHAPVTTLAPINVAGQYVTLSYGNGLTASGGTLGVNTGAGLLISSNQVAMRTPTTLSSASTNVADASGHEHEITATSDARATATAVLLEADGSGQLALDNLYAGALPPSGSATLFAQSSSDTRRTLWLKQKSGQTAEMLRIEDSAGDAFLYLTADGSLESGNPGFVSGQTGWQITAGGDAEFNNAFIRGELHAVTFVADEMHATGGTMAVMTATKVVAPRTSGDNELGAVDASFQLVVQASWDTGLCYFAVDDMIRMKPMGEVASGGSLDLYDIYAQVDTISGLQDRDLANGNPGNFTLACTLRSGGATGFVIPTGTAVVKWGETGGGAGTYTGGMILTSDLNQSPYIDIFTVPSDVAGASWPATSTPRVRVGNLDGVLGLPEQWGIAMGTNLSNTTDAARYIVASDLQLKLNNVDLALWSGASQTVSISSTGTVKFGTDVSADATTNFQYNESTGNVRIGPYTTGKPNLVWDQATGELRLRQYATDVIVLADDGSSYFAGPMTIGTSGGIFQGTGSFASPTTGLKLWNSSGVGKLAGYNAGTIQAQFDTDGKLYAGAGVVRLDANGLTVYGEQVTDVYSSTPATGERVEFRNESDVYLGYIAGVASGTSGAPVNKGVKLGAEGGDFIVLTHSLNARFQTNSTRNIDLYPGGGEVAVFGNLVVSNGMSVGTVLDTPNEGQVILDQGGQHDFNLVFLADSTDVAHGMTTVANTSVFGVMGKLNSANGGLNVLGLSEGSVGMSLQPYGSTNDTASTTAAVGALTVNAYLKNGTGTQAYAANDNLMVVRNAGTTRLIVKGDGDLLYDGTASAYDEWDDVRLLRAADLSLAGRLDEQWAAWLAYNRSDLEQAGILDGEFVSQKRITRLAMGAIWQLHERLARLEMR